MLRYAVLLGRSYFADSGSRLLKSLQLRLVAQNLVFVELQKFNLGLKKLKFGKWAPVLVLKSWFRMTGVTILTFF